MQWRQAGAVSEAASLVGRGAGTGSRAVGRPHPRHREGRVVPDSIVFYFIAELVRPGARRRARRRGMACSGGLSGSRPTGAPPGVNRLSQQGGGRG